MLRKEISSLVLVATITASSLAPVNVYADTLNVTNDAQETRVGEKYQDLICIVHNIGKPMINYLKWILQT